MILRGIPLDQYISIAVGSGCVACAIDGTPGTPAEWHHPRSEVGMSERAADKDGYSLCPGHHRGVGLPLQAHEELCSVHMTPKEFHIRYGDDEQLTKIQRIIVYRILDGSIGMKKA